MFLPYFFKVLHFGNYNCRSVGIIADADQFTLNRVGLHNDISSTPSLFLARLAGLL